jgi:glycosyltransferase involved in cell wall biosynthesis
MNLEGIEVKFRMKKKVLFIYPTSSIDIRLYKFMISFLEENYSIYIAYHKRQDSNIFQNKLKNYQHNITKIKVGNFLPVNFPFNFTRNFKIRKLIKKLKPDIVICRDILLSGFYRLYLNKYIKNSIYLDICDNYPEVIRTVLKGNIGKIGMFIANKIEKNAISKFPNIIFVSNESLRYIKNKHNVEIKHSHIVYNVPYKIDCNIDLIEENNKENDLIYIGTINKNIRDLDTILKSIHYLKKKCNLLINFDIYYFQHQKVIVDYYKEICNVYNIHKQIRFINAVKKEALTDILLTYKIGVVPHCRNKATDFTIPNKIFDYMQHGLPVLASDNPSLKGIIERYNVGVCYKGGDYLDCSKKIEEMFNNHYKYKLYSSNGKKAIKNSFNWDSYFEKFKEKANL